MNNAFNKDYYESGISKGISGYENYKWMPNRSFEEAITITETLKCKNFLDYGCAKGFLVNALRLLEFEAYGEDISDYAINNCHPNVEGFISKPTNKFYDLIFCKDVLEHVPENDLPNLLTNFSKRCNQFFAVVPFADNGLYRIREYEVDVTHITRGDETWWLELFRDSGFKIKTFSYKWGDLKKKWIPINEYANGFFHLESKKID
tara:strand:+ start:1761 stop:2375 length:615 start_codon:yes stop_codon:yes gene_type:complete